MKLKYDQLNSREYESHWIVLKEIQANSNVLDLGCATGYIAKELQKKNCNIWGVEIDKKAGGVAEKYLKKLYIADLKNIDSFGLDKKFFDYILLLDVIEHIVDIEPILTNIKKYLAKNGKIIISTPNIAHLRTRLSLLTGNFDYTEVGIMDKTHVHFYTEKSLLLLLEKVSYKIDKIDYSADFGQIPMGRLLRYLPKTLQHNLTSFFPTLLAVQFIVICQ